MRLYNNGPDFSTPSLAMIARRSLRHFPRGTTSHGLRHRTVIIIAVAASVGSLLVLIFWRILSRRSARSRRAPFPQRQVLGHQRERQLVAFTEHQNASVPKILPDDSSRPPSAPYVDDSLGDSSNTASSSNYEVDKETGADPLSSIGDNLHPPTPPFLTPRTPPNASSTSLPLYNGRSTPSSDGTLPPTAISPSPNQSLKRVADRSGSHRRPVSMVSTGTSQTTMTIRSRPSIRAAPHAPHNNIQIVLPAPLAPGLYERPASEEPRMHRLSTAEGTYADSWRTSLVDTWISVGQHDVPESEPIERKHSHDSMERRSRRLARRGPSPTSARPRSGSNPSPRRSRTPDPSLDGHSNDTHPPVPRVPSKYGTLSKQHDGAPSSTREQRASWNPPSSFNGSHKLRS